MAKIYDLSGAPVPADWGKPGRPQHEATQQNRDIVAMAVTMGWSNERIAAALYVTIPTLNKHYRSELKFREVARDRLTAILATKLWRLFLSGNVAAGKEFRALMEQNDIAVPSGRAAAPTTKEAKLGKKEQAKVDARNPQAGSSLGDLMILRQQQVRPN